MLAETDDWVAMASEYRAIAVLPGAAERGSLGARAGRRLPLGDGAVGMTTRTEGAATVVDLATAGLRELNRRLHEADPDDPDTRRFRVESPNGAHAVACGLDAPLEVEIAGHVGYYCAGMNKQAAVRVRGNAGTGVAENMMSGTVVVDGNASQSAGATGRGGLLVVHGDAGARCGISMKGVDIVVGGSIGHLSAFMAQRGRLVVCGDAGDALGDSIYETHLYVRGPRREPRRRLRREGAAASLTAPSCDRCSSGPATTTSTRRSSAATARRAGSTPSTIDNAGAY